LSLSVRFPSQHVGPVHHDEAMALSIRHRVLTINHREAHLIANPHVLRFSLQCITVNMVQCDSPSPIAPDASPPSPIASHPPPNGSATTRMHRSRPYARPLSAVRCLYRLRGRRREFPGDLRNDYTALAPAPPSNQQQNLLCSATTLTMNPTDSTSTTTGSTLSPGDSSVYSSRHAPSVHRSPPIPSER
jgi:hypothetical protein